MRTDDEQVEELKQLWKKYGRPILTGLIVGLAIVFGGRTWLDYQEGQRQSASAEYEQLRAELAGGSIEAARSRATFLMDRFERAPYAVLGALALAAAEVGRDELEPAQENLAWALSHARDETLEAVARLRLARVQSALGEHEVALATLGGQVPAAFAAERAELQGDILMAMGDEERARRAYEEALAALGFGAGAEILQLKLDNLGEPS